MSISAEIIYEYQQRQAQYYHQKAASHAKIAAIDEKLQRLEVAKQQVNNYQQVIEQLRKDTYKIRDKVEWIGTNKDRFTNKMEDMNNIYKTYCDEVDNYYNNICDAITRLENEKNNENFIISNLSNLINNISNWLEKAMH